MQQHIYRYASRRPIDGLVMGGAVMGLGDEGQVD